MFTTPPPRASVASVLCEHMGSTCRIQCVGKKGLVCWNSALYVGRGGGAYPQNVSGSLSVFGHLVNSSLLPLRGAARLLELASRTRGHIFLMQLLSHGLPHMAIARFGPSMLLGAVWVYALVAACASDALQILGATYGIAPAQIVGSLCRRPGGHCRGVGVARAHSR